MSIDGVIMVAYQIVIRGNESVQLFMLVVGTSGLMTSVPISEIYIAP